MFYLQRFQSHEEITDQRARLLIEVVGQLV